jgi:4-diphosphocytidyl-2-C-methyl-D-erythritol kinase
MLVTAPAKLNLNLHITGKRADGYHLLESLVVFTQFGDTLELRSADHLSLDIGGPFAAGLNRDDNLVLRAARGLQKLSGSSKGAHIILTKYIPVGAGLGGGSSDAAATLRALQLFWDTSINDAQLDHLALQLGSDVPVCYRQVPSWVSGIGDEITPLSWAPERYVLLVNPGKALFTADVYKAFKGPFSIAHMMPQQLGEYLRNDLEAPAVQLMPEISEVLAAIKETPHCKLVRMSGSGATCFGLYAKQSELEAALQQIQKAHTRWWVTATALRNA